MNHYAGTSLYYGNALLHAVPLYSCKDMSDMQVSYRQESTICHSDWVVRIVSRNLTVTPYRCLVMASQLGFTISFLVLLSQNSH